MAASDNGQTDGRTSKQSCSSSVSLSGLSDDDDDSEEAEKSLRKAALLITSCWTLTSAIEKCCHLFDNGNGAGVEERLDFLVQVELKDY